MSPVDLAGSAQTQSAIVGANGSASVSFSSQGSQDWIVKQLSVEGTRGVDIDEVPCLVRLGNSLICGTPDGDLDTADGAPAIVLTRGSILSVTWTGGLAAGSVASCTVWYEVTYHPGQSQRTTTVEFG